MMFTFYCTKNKNNFPKKYVLFKIKNIKSFPHELVLGEIYSDTTIHIYKMGL